MSLVTAGPLARRQLSPFLSHDPTNQRVPDSPLSAFFGTHIPSPPVARLCSPSSGSPLAQVPDCGSPLLRQLLDCELHSSLKPVTIAALMAGRKRQREEGTPSPSPASKRANRDSHRVPNSIIVIKRTAQPSKKGKWTYFYLANKL